MILYQTGEALSSGQKYPYDIVLGVKIATSSSELGLIADNQFLRLQDNDGINWLFQFESKVHRNDILTFLSSNQAPFIIQRVGSELAKFEILPSKLAAENAKFKRRITELEKCLHGIKKKASFGIGDD